MERISITSTIKNAWKTFRKHYFTNVLVVFLVGIIVGGYAFNTGFGALDRTNQPSINAPAIVLNTASGKSNAEILAELIEGQDIFNITVSKREDPSPYYDGVMAVIVNEITSSGSFGFGVLNGLNTLIFKGQIGESVVILLFAVIILTMTIFIKNILVVGKCRYFIEHRKFTDTNAYGILFVYKYGKVWNVAKVMFLKSLFLTLWSFTIIGAIFKAYEYSMIPYILAENPSIKWKDAFKISKELTMGNKKRIFGTSLILSIGYIISPLTLNLLSIFLLDPLMECAYAEIYMELRAIRLPYITRGELLCDNMLAVTEPVHDAYPQEAYFLPTPKRHKVIKINYNRKYTIGTVILFFFTFSFVGWLWEVFYTLATQGFLANRGTMTGPWLPIYGFGGLLIIVGLKPLRNHPFWLFVATFFSCGVLEYFAAWMLETLFKIKWWDYTGFFLNIDSRVCFEGLLVFGLAGVAFTYVFAPLLDNIYSKIKPSVKKPICIVLITLFAIDLAYSAFHPNQGAGIIAGKLDETEGTTIEEVQP